VIKQNGSKAFAAGIRLGSTVVCGGFWGCGAVGSRYRLPYEPALNSMLSFPDLKNYTDSDNETEFQF